MPPEWFYFACSMSVTDVYFVVARYITHCGSNPDLEGGE